MCDRINRIDRLELVLGYNEDMFPLHICQVEIAHIRNNGLIHCRRIYIPAVKQDLKYFVNCLLVVFRLSGCKEVKGDPELHPCIQKLGVKAIGDFLRINIFLVGSYCDRRSMRIATRNHQNIITD